MRQAVLWPQSPFAEGFLCASSLLYRLHDVV
jgi:hypothetical protein